MSNGWFVPVDTAFIIVIVSWAQTLSQSGWRTKRETRFVSKLTHQNEVASVWNIFLEGSLTTYFIHHEFEIILQPENLTWWSAVACRNVSIDLA